MKQNKQELTSKKRLTVQKNKPFCFTRNVEQRDFWEQIRCVLGLSQSIPKGVFWDRLIKGGKRRKNELYSRGI